MITVAIEHLRMIPWIAGGQEKYQQNSNCMHNACRNQTSVFPVNQACTGDRDASHPIARPNTDLFPRILINIIKIIGQRENHPALRAGQNSANSACDKAKLAATGTALHALPSLPAPRTTAGGICIMFYYSIGVCSILRALHGAFLGEIRMNGIKSFMH